MTLFLIVSEDTVIATLPADIDLPFTPREFRTVAEDKVVSPLIVTAFPTFSAESVANEVSASMLAPPRKNNVVLMEQEEMSAVPPTYRLFLARRSRATISAFPAESVVPFIIRSFLMIAEDRVVSPLIVTAFPTFSAESVANEVSASMLAPPLKNSVVAMVHKERSVVPPTYRLFPARRSRATISVFPAESVVPFIIRSFSTIADDRVVSPPIVVLFKTASEDNVATPPTLILFTTRKPETVASALTVSVELTYAVPLTLRAYAPGDVPTPSFEFESIIPPIELEDVVPAVMASFVNSTPPM